MTIEKIFTPQDDAFYAVITHAAGPQGALPLTPQMLMESPSGNLFGMTQNAGMGWDANRLTGKEVLIIGTQGGIRAGDGRPIALGYHTGHWEIGMQMQAAAKEITRSGGIPFAAFVSDPCDGRSQGTHGMFDSLPYRNDAAIVFRRLIRSLPTRRAVIGVATCDKGLPATMIALAAMHNLPTILVPGGATLPHSALAPSGQAVWLEIARQSARAVSELDNRGITTRDILTDKAIENAMVIHAAFGGSTNLLLHIPAIAHAAGCTIPDVEHWTRVNRRVPRLVSVLPNGPDYHPTVRAFLAGGVPEVMLHLRDLGLLHLDAMTVTGQTVGENLDWWQASERRVRFRQCLREQDGVDPNDVILPPEKAKAKGLTSTVCFPTGNIAPEGSVIKATAIDPSVVGEDGVYRHTGRVRVFVSEAQAIKAIKREEIEQGDIMVVIGGGPSGTGMEETYQLTSALKHISWGKTVSLITDARFSGVSTGACFGHVSPEALAGGPIGKLRDNDIIEIAVDRLTLTGSVNFIGTADNPLTPEEGARELARRQTHPDLHAHDFLPDDTRLWAALQSVSGGTWKGCIYDTDKIIEVINAGKKALGI
ncbi:dihydroxy-acid dehydratase [Enterobacter asburiae]|uniref:xylonate dehydratase n=1 Tax=Enterobacter asburiae TaxID=61645 RepID=A0A8I1KFG7_ENTAS|nr:dihydroxy-acid dehydratase [Enterobacter asburiae]MBJ6598195.1 YjhG/YagF family D-xylonate dehydratase [Enterobacter asburiae]